jgi:hypothetical protein
VQYCLPGQSVNPRPAFERAGIGEQVQSFQVVRS